MVVVVAVVVVMVIMMIIMVVIAVVVLVWQVVFLVVVGVEGNRDRHHRCGTGYRRCNCRHSITLFGLKALN